MLVQITEGCLSCHVEAPSESMDACCYKWNLVFTHLSLFIIYVLQQFLFPKGDYVAFEGVDDSERLYAADAVGL